MRRGYRDEAAESFLLRLPQIRAESPLALVMMWETNAMYRLSMAGRFREAVELGLVTIRRLRSPLLARRNWDYVCGALAESMIELGRWREAEEFLTQTRASGSEGIYLRSLELLSGVIHARTGDTESATRAIDAAVAATSAPGMAAADFIQLQIASLDAELALQRGDLERTRVTLSEFLTRPAYRGDPELWRPLLLAARVEAELSAAGSRSDPTHFDEIAAIADQIRGTSAFAAVWTAQLDAERRRAEGTDSPALWKVVADRWAGNGQVHDQAYALVRLGEAALRAADEASARAALEQAVSLAKELGARPVIEAARDVARRGRLTFDAVATADTRPPRSLLGRLTPRELDVLRLVATGQNNEQIGTTLFISPKTASVHVSRILAKLGVASRTEAAAVAHREQLLETEPEIKG
jgi:DNA-binding CsgD family transcriptional regulator